ncbi:transposase, IS4 family [Desulfacinum hydrothermale DSM 13146]|uniref:Transposase, IS4 family n=1 Tax=Desulfacinum hydrothermale DSM 13146 TaxID=1121390 RepID=A0A1W1XF92_9BACT|nr:transposase, IS4 family [Desulfacinum hydrothermale DSM 13146]
MISHADVVKTYLDLLCLGKSDFEAGAGVSSDDWFKEALDIQKVPSQETMRQRLDKHASVFERLASLSNIELLERIQVPVTALSTGHVPLDLDVFCLDNSDTKKEGVSRTYQDYDGYAPIGAYLGQEGWCVGLELRPGSQHSQSGFVDFLRKTLRHARKVTRKPLLVRTDAAHDALETLVELRRHPKVSFIIRWNPRRADILSWRDRAFREGRVCEPRAGKKVAIFSTWVTRHHEERTYRFWLVIRVTERISDSKGQILIRPDINLEGWWTSLSVPEDEVIRLYEKRGLSEQFHSEIKSDLDLERLLSGKFATNALVLTLGGLAYNILRILGQTGLLAHFSPVRHRAKRRRIKTVMQELIYLAARVIRSGRRLKLQFGRHCPAFHAFRSVYLKFCPA